LDVSIYRKYIEQEIRKFRRGYGKVREGHIA
jgi:hypothetical protein